MGNSREAVSVLLSGDVVEEGEDGGDALAVAVGHRGRGLDADVGLKHI